MAHLLHNEIEVETVWAAEAATGEGPIWDHRGAFLWWIDIPGGRLFRYTPGSDAQEEWKLGEMAGTVALTEDPDTPLLALESGLARFDTTHGVKRPVAAFPQPEPRMRFNEGKCDSRGRLWVGTMSTEGKAGAGIFYRYTREQGFCAMLGKQTIPNGLVWNCDDTLLYHIDSPEKCAKVLEFNSERGTLGRELRRIPLKLPGADPDGMSIDVEGRLWVAYWGGGCVQCHDPESGVCLARIPLPVSQVTSCCFGGPDLTDLYITSASQLSPDQQSREPLAGSLFRIRLGNVRGLASPIAKI